MKKRTRSAVKLLVLIMSALLVLSGLGPVTVNAAGNDSVYLQLSGDITINSTTTVLTTTINLPSTQKIFLQSDGRYYASSTNPCAKMQLKVDSSDVGNASIIDWRNTTNKAQHSYNCIAAVTLAAGTHTISLVATPIEGSFVVGSGSNLCVMTNITVNVQTASMGSDSSNFNFTTYGITPPNAVPHTPLLSVNTNNSSGPVIALASARAYSSAAGDKMLGIYKDGTALPNDQGIWTVNDYHSGCESQAPMYSHAYMNVTGNHTVSMDATEFPWSTAQGEDPAQYQVGSTSSLVVLSGAMKVSGSAPQSTAVNNCWDWNNIGTGDGTAVPIATAVVNIPSGHNGVVMFQAKTRFQADTSDTGGNGFIWINIDGVDRGSTGVQQIVQGSGDSQRTACASYLSAGSNALAPGNHTVTVYAKAVGSFLHLSTVKDLPLIWFDGTSGNPSPNAFSLNSPANNSTSIVSNPTFKWAPSLFASSYSLVVSRYADLSSPVVNQTDITGTSYTPAVTLSYGTKYYWKVTAVNSAGSTVAYNSNFNFTTVPGANFLSNPGFESGMTSWSTSGTNADADYTSSGGYTGSNCLVHWKGSPYNVYTYQTVTGLTNGLYTAVAWVKNDYGNLGTAYMEAKNYGGSNLTASIPTTSEWKMVTISNINVTNGSCTIGFYSNSPANSWYWVDDVYLFKQ